MMLGDSSPSSSQTYEIPIEKNWLPTLKDLYKEIDRLGEKYENGDYIYKRTLYDLCDFWEKIKHSDYKEYKESRYLCNSKTKEYIDLDTLPVEWTKTDDDGQKVKVSIDPLPLLIAMGNDRGSGDYHEEFPSYKDVGKWVSNSENIFFTDNSDDLIGFTEYKPDFTENI